MTDVGVDVSADVEAKTREQCVDLRAWTAESSLVDEHRLRGTLENHRVDTVHRR